MEEIAHKASAKSIRLGWLPRNEQKPERLCNIVGNGMKIENNYDVSPSQFIIP
jgi:hypothetical protein